MKLTPSRRQKKTAQVLAEACIGLSLMTFTWILIAYSLYLANYQIRTEMAARYAAWYTGNNNGTAPTAAQLDQYFFPQSGLSKVTSVQPVLLPDVITSSMPGTTAYTNDSSSANGPFRENVAFGPSTLDSTSNPFPFNLLNPNIKIPFMPDFSNFGYSVNSSCQWDGDSDTWNTFSSAMSGMWNTLSSNLSQMGPVGSTVSGFFSSLF